ncbi:MAG: hypothetical protein MUD12_07880 [Spirochaetes bacterium]|jgi:hypothetical protein|nr:hypothetical protein [Spirochaetota bacterium]
MVDAMRTENFIKTVLKVKTAVTLAVWSIPLLFFPAPLFDFVGVPAPDPMIFGRLLGSSFLALCSGYAFGIRMIDRGGNIEGVLWMGIVSNGLAFVLLLVHGLLGAWSCWPAPGRAYMWFSALATLAFSVAVSSSLVRYRKMLR